MLRNLRGTKISATVFEALLTTNHYRVPNMASDIEFHMENEKSGSGSRLEI